jgi:hypothetical protein
MAADWLDRLLLNAHRLGFFPSAYFPGGGEVGTLEEDYNWPAPVPEGPRCVPMAKLAALVAICPTFRSRCDVPDDDSASKRLIAGDADHPQRIFFPDVDWDKHDVFPSAVIQPGANWRGSTDASGRRHYLKFSGNLRLILMDKDRYDGDMGRSLRDFENFLGNLAQDLAIRFARNDNLAATDIQIELPPALCSDEETVSRGKAYWTASFLVDWS